MKTNLLEEKIGEKKITKAAVAKVCGMDKSTWFRKVKNGNFTVEEAKKIVEFLEIDAEEAKEIFLT